MATPRTQLSRKRRNRVLQRCKSKCVYCGNLLLSNYHVDHMISLVENGFDCEGNLVATCSNCNLSKNRKSIDPLTVPRLAELPYYSTSSVRKHYEAWCLVYKPLPFRSVFNFTPWVEHTGPDLDETCVPMAPRQDDRTWREDRERTQALLERARQVRASNRASNKEEDCRNCVFYWYRGGGYKTDNVKTHVHDRYCRDLVKSSNTNANVLPEKNANVLPEKNANVLPEKNANVLPEKVDSSTAVFNFIIFLIIACVIACVLASAR